MTILKKNDAPSTPSPLPTPPVVEEAQAQGNDYLAAIDQQQVTTTTSSSVADLNKNPSLRQVVGWSMERFSNLVNENLIAARYGASASIFLLTAYGLSNTPLFFRFRTVSEIPGRSFVDVCVLGRVSGYVMSMPSFVVRPLPKIPLSLSCHVFDNFPSIQLNTFLVDASCTAASSESKSTSNQRVILVHFIIISMAVVVEIMVDPYPFN
jgi:hypothetical protein